MHMKILKGIKIWGQNSIHCLLKVPNVGLQDCLGPQSTRRDLPFRSGEFTLLYGLRPLSMGSKAPILSLRPPATPEKLVLGDYETPIWPKFQGHQELAID
ncbi:hypothetical protein O181_095348 [Austropuccinia psidii MF-1]|uniref:Uncharacterized protein n=1 Tax=Austropuccinia psidii MF-1 TaxID=1389203 RepID=A0A9Q3PB42_9BASI|nr:hypothetical protein [Austropuccinia psidii MF-1]